MKKKNNVVSNYDHKMYLTEEELPLFSIKYFDKLIEMEIPQEEHQDLYRKFLKNNVIIKYSKKWQDDNLQYWIDTIQQIPGGYWIVQELINQPHVEYEHYNFKQKMSYEKGNVSTHRANIELKKENREAYNYFHHIRENKNNKNVIEINVEGEITSKKETFIKK